MALAEQTTQLARRSVVRTARQPANVIGPFLFPMLLLAVNTGGRIAWAMRKDSPQLRQMIDGFVQTSRQGTVLGNVLYKKYLRDGTTLKDSTSEAELRKFHQMVDIFKRYAGQYSFDHLMLVAQGYQESRLDQDARSPVGAIGIMQVMPATGAELKVGDITLLEPNIHAGVKYMRQVLDANFKDEPMDTLNRGLFTFASYNAGPGRVRQLRREAAKRGLDPNVWFGNVEQIASERIGRETVTYVSNIYKYYVAYKLIVEENNRRNAAKAAIRKGT